LVLFKGALLGLVVEPLDTSSIVGVLVRVVVVWVVHKNFVLVRDPWGHVAYFAYDLLTVSYKFSLIVSRRALDNIINPLFIIFHVLNFTLVKMRIFRWSLIHFDLFLL